MMSQYGLLAIVGIVLVAGVSDALPPQKIVGGQIARLGEFPYQVSLRVNGQHYCGGSIISQRHVLTAAHCVANVVTYPYTNLLIVTGTVQANAGQTHTVKAVLYHSQFGTQGGASPNDIAIIALHRDIPITAYQAAVALPTGPTPSRVVAKVTGWGSVRAGTPSMSNDLLKTTVTTLTAAECQQYFIGAAILYTHQICAYGTPGTGICQGDSGGPLVYNNQLIGVVSFNIPCGNGIPDVYSSVYHYIDWIRQVIAMA